MLLLVLFACSPEVGDPGEVATTSSPTSSSPTDPSDTDTDGTTDTDDTTDTDTADTPPGDGVTWQRDIRPIMDGHCIECHADGAIAPFSFEDWETVSIMAPSIVGSVEAGTMPPYQFDEDCQPTASHLPLDDEEQALFTAWADDGYIEGDEADYVPDPVEVAELPPFDIEFRPVEPFEVDLTRPDFYRCMVSDTVFEEDTWITGTDALIDNPEFVHHLLYYTVPAAQADTLQAMDDADPGPGIACYDDWSFWMTPGLESIGGWAPGNDPHYQDPDGEERVGAFLVRAGSLVIIEGHFNSIATEDVAATDSSGFGAWTLPKGENPDDIHFVWQAADWNLNIPAGAEAHVEGASTTVPFDAEIVSANAHMHLLGTRMESTITRSDGSTVCTTRVEPYDFDWQWNYRFAEPVAVQAGDVIDMTCTYDNTAANQPIIDGEQQEPRDVHYGDGTTDEMCINYFVMSVPYEP